MSEFDNIGTTLARRCSRVGVKGSDGWRGSSVARSMGVVDGGNSTGSNEIHGRVGLYGLVLAWNDACSSKGRAAGLDSDIVG